MRLIPTTVLLFSFVFALISSDVHARSFRTDPSLQGPMTTIPDCMAGSRKLDVDNDVVLKWKATSRDQYRARARVKGTITKVYANRTGHIHLQATIGKSANDTVEIIYNEAFGRVASLPLNSVIEACGDYITARRPSRGYPASPDGALVHWVHKSSNPNHESGYIAIDGTVYGH